MYLILLETSGNQNYIFSTNKLRENVGASELTYHAGTKWVLDVVGEINQTQSFGIWKNSELLRDKLTNRNHNPPIEESDKPVEIIIAASGKAILIAENQGIAKQIITKVTTKALKCAPGIDLCGVYVEFDWQEDSIQNAIKEMYRKFEEVHGKYPSPNLRFQRLPIIDECSTSGFPASRLNPKNKPISLISHQKQKYLKESLERIDEILPSEKKKKKIRFVREVGELESNFENLEWLGVVHADGNGLGQIFLNFGQYLDNKPDSKEFNREYVDKLRKFSIALDICTEKAFLSAIEVFEPDSEGIIPLLPLILGGDDLTVICDGKFALKFTHLFLREFEAETAKSEHQEGIIPAIAKKAFRIGKLSACAGIAIVKPHFPFSVAYELAESLIKQAKNVKKKVLTADSKPFPCSALEFHIVYDSSGVELESIRKKLTVDEGSTKLYNQPYVVTNKRDLETAQGLDWAKFHHWEKLEKQIRIISLTEKVSDTEEEQKNLIPTGQLNNLRLALFSGKEIADAQYKLIYQRYKKRFDKLLGDEDESSKDEKDTKYSLFDIEPDSEDIYTTGLLDALSAVDFWH